VEVLSTWDFDLGFRPVMGVGGAGSAESTYGVRVCITGYQLSAISYQSGWPVARVDWRQSESLTRRWTAVWIV